MQRKDPFVTGEYYHLYNRGIDKRNIFKSELDYKRFVMLLNTANSNASNPLRLDNLINQQDKTYEDILKLEKEEPLVSIGAWCLMTNHFHILVRQEVDGGITKFMRKLGTGYSMFFNIKYQRQGSLFGGRFKSRFIGVDDNYMKHLFGYIHLNPLDIEFSGWKQEIGEQSSNMKKFLKEYPYSSYLDYADGERTEKNIIEPESFPEYFQDAKEFKDFVENYFSDPDF